ncbi:MAG TPA: hypothetical protein VLF21_03420 [Candidatus Saccharimonadales bacterium]|nr:hypothetical protein [Candidatus Saccharimonadales bacterium]
MTPEAAPQPAPENQSEHKAEVIPIRPEATKWPSDELAQAEMKLAATQRSEKANLARPISEQDPMMTQIREEIVGNLTDHIADLKANRTTEAEKSDDQIAA